MGYNYKTTDPTDTDFITGAPTSIMTQALQTASEQDDQQIKSLDLFGNSVANVPHLAQDSDAVKAIQDKYNSQIDDATNQILSDPASYQKHMPLIRGIQRDLTTNLDSGELASYSNKAAQLAQWQKDNHQKVVGENGKPGTVTPEAYQAAYQHILSDYSQRSQANGGKSYNSVTGTSIPLQTEDLYDTPDINKKLKEATDGIKANDTNYTKDRITGQYIYTGKQGTEQVEAKRVADLSWNALQSDPEVMGWARQGHRLGYLNGVAYPQGTKDTSGNDISGQMIQPYTTDKDGNPVFNSASMFAAPIKANIDKSAYAKTTNDQTAKVNEYGIKGYESDLKLKNDKAMAAIDDAYKSQDEQRAAALKDQAEKELSAWKFAVGNNTSYQQVMDRVLGNGSSQITASPDGKTTVSPFAGLDKNPDGTYKPVTSTAVNSVLLPASTAKMTDLVLKMKDPNITDNQRALYQQQLTNEQANHDFLSDASGKAYTSAVGDLVKSKKYTSDDLNNYYNYQKPEIQDSYKKTLQGLQDELQGLVNPDYTKATNSLTGVKNGVNSNIPVYTDASKAKELLTHIQNINKTTDKYNQIGQDINDKTAQWFQKNAAPSNQVLNGIGLDVPSKQLIYGQLKSNPEVDIRDLNTDNSGEAKQAQEILKNVVSKGENIADYFDVKTINPPVAGVGVTATIRMKKPNEGAIGGVVNNIFGRSVNGTTVDNKIFDHDMIMTLPSSVLNALGTNMKKNGGTDNEKATGELITNKAESDLLSSLKHRYVAQTPEGYSGPVGTASYYDPTTKQQLGITLVPHTVPGNASMSTYSIYVKDANGNNHLFSTPDNPKGEFANEESATQALLGTQPKK